MDWREKLHSLSFSGEIFYGEPLSKHTHFKIGGPAAALAIPRSTEDLIALGKFLNREKAPAYIFGLGSNLLVRDGGVNALFIKTTKLPATIDHEVGGIRVGAGVSVAALLRRAANEGWDGFEAISGVPGTLGGVVAMNAGTHLGEAAARILEVRTINLAKPELPILTRTKDALVFSYRRNHFLEPLEIVIDSLWTFTAENPSKIREKLEALYQRRKETQPLDYPSCGSVFKNPIESGMRAWEVIDRLGMRGHQIGNAQISAKHPNWILNLGEAKASDVIALIGVAKDRAKTELGITLVEEVRII